MESRWIGRRHVGFGAYLKILLVKALAESHAYSQFVNSLHQALAELGHESTVSDQSVYAVRDAVDLTRLTQQLRTMRYDAMVSFNSFFGSVALSNGVSLFDFLGVKFLGWLVDHPIYAPHGLTRSLQNRYAVYANPNHLRFAKALKLPGRGVAMLPGANPPQSASKAYGSREWGVFVAATWNGIPNPLWESLDESPAKNLLVGIVERLLADREASLLDAFNDTADTLKLGARLGVDPAFDDQMIAFLRDPLTYFRHLDRINVIQSLADSGLPLTICGPGWRDFLGNRTNVTYLDHRVDFKDLPALYGNSKVVINLNAANGACERAIHAAMAGAAVVSDYSESLAHLFEGPGERTFFNRAKMGDVAEVAARLLESNEGETVAERCHARVLETGLWRHRAAQMVEFLTAA